METLECESQPYEKLNQTAMRIEQCNLTLRNGAVVPRRSCEAGGEGTGFKVQKLGAKQRGTTDSRDESRGEATRKRAPLCCKCHGAGHIAKDCRAQEQRRRSIG
ncbi:unnamed protein product [Heligmosomoides polygyrus]|uniref:CCHC-type domain-containing protein n=1 Tax=Heligmosomoides polygyrus TaxID=6339 RepID=A0A183GWG9_HELPZ|nr:unnamed protein product [Heligmosomoides polygyrus]